MLSIAFKEWAVICSALASGRQSLILRKGGIAEEGGVFRPEHSEFLLYPTYFHEHRAGIKPEFLPLLEEADAAKPPPGRIIFTHFVRVDSVSQLTNLDTALALDSLHAWTPDVVKQRFHYRTPGLFVLAVRVFRLAQPVEEVERPEFAGCKTWVQLDQSLGVAVKPGFAGDRPRVSPDTTGAQPVLPDEEFAEFRSALAGLCPWPK